MIYIFWREAMARTAFTAFQSAGKLTLLDVLMLPLAL